MAMSFEWADVDRAATIWRDVDLVEVSDDDVTPGTIGVSADTGSNGIMLWGERQDLITWLEDAARRLRGGEGMSGYGEEREFVLPGRTFTLQDADGELFEGWQVSVGCVLPDNATPVVEDGQAWPEPAGDRWRVMDEPRIGQAADGRVGLVIRTRKVIVRP